MGEVFTEVGVWAANIERVVVADIGLCEPFERSGVVVDGRLDGRRLRVVVHGDRDADDQARLAIPRLQALDDAIDAVILQSLVDHEALGADGATKPRGLVSGARTGGHGAHLDAAETDAAEDLREATVVVEASGEDHGNRVTNAIDDTGDVGASVAVDSADEPAAGGGRAEELASADE